MKRHGNSSMYPATVDKSYKNCGVSYAARGSSIVASKWADMIVKHKTVIKNVKEPRIKIKTALNSSKRLEITVAGVEVVAIVSI